MPFDKITLNSGSSLILSHCPDSLTLKQVADKQVLEKKAIESFGLFDTAQPNFQTYYPNVTAEDLKPKEDQFIRPIFRALSETIVHRKYNPIDFAKNKVLKASMHLLLGQSIYANHEALVGNEIGSVSKVEWESAYTASNGLRVPAGINAEFLIDGKSHPKTARGILMDPPSIHSNSVTVAFEWEQSHPKLESNEFRGKIGTFGEDGELVRRVVKQIMGYHETSLVAHGADPFAQLIKEGEINNPAYVKAFESLSAKTGTQHYFFNYRTDITSLSDEELITGTNTIETDINMKDILALLAAFFNVTTLTEDEAKAKLSTDLKDLKLADLQKSHAELAAEKQKVIDADAAKVAAEQAKLTAETALTAEKDKVTKLEPLKVVVEANLAAKRTDVTRMYNIIFAGKTDATMLESITKADDTLLTSLQTTYQKLMDDKFPGHCNDCKSTNVSRNSAIIEPPAGGSNEPEKLGKPKTNAEVVAEFSKKKVGTFVHGKATEEPK